MEPESQKQIKKPHICEICLRHDPMVKDYAEDLELQAAIRAYIEKETGEKVEISDIAKMCDSCYFMVNDLAEQKGV